MKKLFLSSYFKDTAEKVNFSLSQEKSTGSERNRLSEFLQIRCIVPHHTNAPIKKEAEKIKEQYSSVLTLYPISGNEDVLVSGNDVQLRSL